MPYNIIKERAYPMIISENMQKITSNKVLENISVIQLSEVLCELDLMGALKNEPWRSRGSEVNYMKA